MNHHDTALWPVWVSWIANGLLWLTFGMSPLQVIAVVVTIGFTVHRWWRWALSSKTE